MTVKAVACIVDESNDEIAYIEVEMPINNAINVVEEFFKQARTLPAAARGAYSLEYEGVVLRQSPLEEIDKILVFPTYY